MQYYIKEEVWEKILVYLESVKGIHTEDKQALRRFIEAIYFIARGGCAWRLLPNYYGDWRAVHKRFKQWVEWGIWKKFMKYTQNEPDFEAVMIDSTIVRAHACSAGYGKYSQEREALGRSCGGFTTKIHAIADALGNPLEFILTAGQRNDITQAQMLTKNLSNMTVIADKAYDSNDFLEHLETRNCTPVIPPRENRTEQRLYDKHVYKERHQIECLFGKMKHYRHISSRFDKSAAVFMGFLHFVGALIWLR